MRNVPIFLEKTRLYEVITPALIVLYTADVEMCSQVRLNLSLLLRRQQRVYESVPFLFLLFSWPDIRCDGEPFSLHCVSGRGAAKEEEAPKEKGIPTKKDIFKIFSPRRRHSFFGGKRESEVTERNRREEKKDLFFLTSGSSDDDV